MCARLVLSLTLARSLALALCLPRPLPPTPALPPHLSRALSLCLSFHLTPRLSLSRAQSLCHTLFFPSPFLTRLADIIVALASAAHLHFPREPLRYPVFSAAAGVHDYISTADRMQLYIYTNICICMCSCVTNAYAPNAREAAQSGLSTACACAHAR